MDDFEQRLKQQPMRRVPESWRAEILAVCRGSRVEGRAQEQPRPASFLSTLNHQLSTLLWPHPKAWGGLAAIWVFIFAMNVSMRETLPPAVAKKPAPPSAEMVAELKQQRRLFAELAGVNEAQPADRQKFPPLPRSERRLEVMVV